MTSKREEVKQRKADIFSWLDTKVEEIKFAKKGYIQTLCDEYNQSHPDNQLKSKTELSRWLYAYRRDKSVHISYCPTAKKRTRSRNEHSNYEEA